MPSKCFVSRRLVNADQGTPIDFKIMIGDIHPFLVHIDLNRRYFLGG